MHAYSLGAFQFMNSFCSYLRFFIAGIHTLSARVPECQKIEKGGLDQYGPECFGRLCFATIRKSVGLKRLINRIRFLSTQVG